MSESLSTYVRGVSAPGPKAKAVTLGVTEEGVALWTWMANDVVVVPGMTFSCESVGFGEVQTSYTKDGVEVALKRPKRQVFLYAEAVLDAPESEPVVTTAVVTDAAREYAEKYAAAQSRAEDPSDDGDEPF